MAKPAGAPAPSSAAYTGEPGARPPLSWHLPVLQLAAITLTLDQFSKYLVRELLVYRGSFPDAGVLRFTHTHNTGSAFGIFQGHNAPLIFVSFFGIAVLLAIYFSQPRPGNLLRFSLGLMMGGAVGNLVDRLHQGWVTDFIDIGPWPVFNLADASIVTGLVLLGWIFLRPAPKGPPYSMEAPDGQAAPANDGVSGPTWCPICDGAMVVLANGWRCAYCGVRERVELPQVSNRTITSTHPAGSPSPEVGPATGPYSSENLATGSSPPGVSQSGLSRPES